MALSKCMCEKMHTYKHEKRGNPLLTSLTKTLYAILIFIYYCNIIYIYTHKEEELRRL